MYPRFGHRTLGLQFFMSQLILTRRKQSECTMKLVSIRNYMLTTGHNCLVALLRFMASAPILPTLGCTGSQVITGFSINLCCRANFLKRASWHLATTLTGSATMRSEHRLTASLGSYSRNWKSTEWYVEELAHVSIYLSLCLQYLTELCSSAHCLHSALLWRASHTKSK